MAEGDLTWSSEHTIHYTDGVLQNFTPENYIILLMNVIPIHSVKEKGHLTFLCLPSQCWYKAHLTGEE